MKFAKLLARKAARSFQRWQGRIFRCRAIYQTWLAGGSLSLSASCRLVVPLVTNGKGKVIVGDRVSLGYALAPQLGDGHILLQARTSHAEICIGNGTLTSNNIQIIALEKVKIGETCQIGDQVSIFDADFHEISPESRNQSSGAIAPVNIGNNVWLGSRVMILKGVTIGDHAVIAAGSVVTQSLPERCLAAGIPARVIRHL